MLSVILLNVVFYFYAECIYVECRVFIVVLNVFMPCQYAECHYTEYGIFIVMLCNVMQSVNMISIVLNV
jgi:hypothetical protein